MSASLGKPRDITGTDEAAPPIGVDVLAYLDHIPISEWGGFKRWENFVEKVYRYPDNDHVLFMTQTKNVYMVVIVRLDVALIRGHMLLDLNDACSTSTWLQLRSFTSPLGPKIDQ